MTRAAALHLLCRALASGPKNCQTLGNMTSIAPFLLKPARMTQAVAMPGISSVFRLFPAITG
jgi:hypothetical protein